MDGYIQHPLEFILLPEVAETIVAFREWVDTIVVVTNQRGIARGLMTEEDLEKVHLQMIVELGLKGAAVDDIFYCPHERDAGCDCRKPLPGMALQAKMAFPKIDFEKSLLIGDTATDMQMGRALGMLCVHVGPEAVDPHLFDLHLPDLGAFWKN
ncbi:UNVERIFIED_CONTAM: hypothetical protein GTU68_033209 [Idotea baltica]|nr:hypothetical protein [Idotea baltica]